MFGSSRKSSEGYRDVIHQFYLAIFPSSKSATSDERFGSLHLDRKFGIDTDNLPFVSDFFGHFGQFEP